MFGPNAPGRPVVVVVVFARGGGVKEQTQEARRSLPGSMDDTRKQSAGGLCRGTWECNPVMTQSPDRDGASSDQAPPQRPPWILNEDTTRINTLTHPQTKGIHVDMVKPPTR